MMFLVNFKDAILQDSRFYNKKRISEISPKHSNVLKPGFAFEMSKMVGSQMKSYVVWFSGFMFHLFLLSESTVRRENITKSNSRPVQLQILDDQVVVDNGLAKFTFSNPGGMITGINYNGIENILEQGNVENNRGYWDVVWSKLEDPGDITDKLRGTNLTVVVQNEDQVELSFTKTWIPTLPLNDTTLPLNIDKRYIVLRGVPGFYSYATFERLKGWRNMVLYQGRIVFKLQEKLFRYMALSDDRQRVMPTPEDRERGTPLAYPEAVLWKNPSSGKPISEVDDKYQYSTEDKDNRVHGWISSNPATGFWMITPSNEFRVAGPVKQDLTSHVGPTTLSMFFSTHYAGKSLGLEFEDGEPWKKVFGPVFIYLNSGLNKANTTSLWQDAKEQMLIETESWPYNFLHSGDYFLANKRGTLSGTLLVRDRILIPANFANVGLGLPGAAGSWQTENKGYQFWTQTDDKGSFLIKNVLPGTYNLYAWVPGFIGDYVYEKIVTITPGSNIKLNNVVYTPPRNGPILWEIGIPDRTAAEFFIPAPLPTLENKLLSKLPKEGFRQYGLWDRYTDLHPTEDLTFTIGVSSYQKDWFYFQATRRLATKTYVPTTWKILFDLKQVATTKNYTLQLALASASEAELQVRINDGEAKLPHFTTGLIGNDNAIARHGIHGLYHLYSVNFLGSLLQSGKNIIFLTQSRGGSPFNGFMYDYIRLEQPPSTN
ncbi:Rhamnogalacturonan endolyase [Heracleum sosnowskyi]|uniref:rhamnogalacturonan endolyase n=1 Tax=Heracleum sosnowskyi TaxID=360622 RepID=A0AAD8MG64_9APIA|nr:Rhamnogalacturonan endolyase [Heracleum sosnowskyi]